MRDPTGSLQWYISNSSFKMGCQPFIGNQYSPYGFRPSLGPGLALPIIFAILMFLHFLQSIRSRYWWFLILSMGCLGEPFTFLFPKTFILTHVTCDIYLAELIGWASGARSSVCPNNMTLYLIQISTLITPVRILNPSSRSEDLAHINITIKHQHYFPRERTLF
jgi:hypothetical protein